MDGSHPLAWIWFVIGGAFVLFPGVVIIYYFTGGYPYPSYVSIYVLVLVFGPPLVLVAIGVLAIAYGLLRHFPSRH